MGAVAVLTAALPACTTPFATAREPVQPRPRSTEPGGAVSCTQGSRSEVKGREGGGGAGPGERDEETRRGSFGRVRMLKRKCSAALLHCAAAVICGGCERAQHGVAVLRWGVFVV
eukprot:364814-Chlamydomonas_euryale.AAC.13